MNPDPTIPFPAGPIEALLVITFALHVIPMNVALGGTLIAAVCQLIARVKDSSPHAELARRILAWIPSAVALTITFGVPPLLFLQVRYTQPFLLTALTMPWIWIASVGLLAIGYAVTYRIATASEDHPLLTWIAALMFLAVGMVFSLMMGTMSHAEPRVVLPARFAHALVGSTAIAGLFTAWVGRGDAWRVTLGCRLFAILTGVQTGVGLWFLFSLPEEHRNLFLGGRTLHTLVLWISVASAGGAVVAALRGRLIPATAMIVPTIFGMAWARHLLREAHLHPAPVEATGSAAPVVIFFVCAGAAVLLIVWMVRRTASSS